jgi:hypothetical protein
MFLYISPLHSGEVRCIKTHDLVSLDKVFSNGNNVFIHLTSPEWRGEMYKNIVTIAEYLIKANKVMSLSSGQKEKQISELNSIILEFEGCGDDIADLSNERNKKDFQQGIKKVDKQFKKAIKMLENYKSGI